MAADLRSLDAALKDTYPGRKPTEQLNNSGGTMAAAPKKMAPLGSGERFSALQGVLAKKGAKNPGALAAMIGRAKYGKAQFAKMGQAGKARKAAGK